MADATTPLNVTTPPGPGDPPEDLASPRKLDVPRWLQYAGAAFTLPPIGYGSIAFFSFGVSYFGTAMIAFIRSLPKISYPSFEQCAQRVAKHQMALFSPPPFATIQGSYRSWPLGGAFSVDVVDSYMDANYTNILKTLRPLCSDGFHGNSDLYGQGYRISIYLQWISSILTNHLLLKSRSKLQQAYLIPLFAIFIAILVSTVQNKCVFAVEIIVLYWFFWGGFYCVFIQPNLKATSKVIWHSFRWQDAALSTLAFAMGVQTQYMLYTGAFGKFPHMPCGLITVPPSSISESVNPELWTVKDTLDLASLFFLLFVMPAFQGHIIARIAAGMQHAVFLYPEWSHSIKQSAAFQELCIFFKRPRWGTARDSSLPDWLMFLRVRRGFPPTRQPGCYKVTALEGGVKKRHRILHAIFSAVIFVTSITIIELTLKMHKVRGIHTVNSPGQYMALLMGIASLIVVLYDLAKERMLEVRQKRLHALEGTDIELSLIAGAYFDDPPEEYSDEHADANAEDIINESEIIESAATWCVDSVAAASGILAESEGTLTNATLSDEIDLGLQAIMSVNSDSAIAEVLPDESEAAEYFMTSPFAAPFPREDGTCR